MNPHISTTNSTVSTTTSTTSQRGDHRSPADVVARFNEAFNRHDVDAVMALMSADCVFEGTAPPDGDRYERADAVRGAWQALFASSPDAHFTAEEILPMGDRVVVRWCYRWGSAGGHVRGIDLFRVSDGLVTEKLAYVKG
jgi:ketosteroid isomerase-like protein